MVVGSSPVAIFFNVFLSYPFSQNISVRYFNSAFKNFPEQIFVALARNPLNMLVTVSGDIQECGLICTFVRAGLRCYPNFADLNKFKVCLLHEKASEVENINNFVGYFAT